MQLNFSFKLKAFLYLLIFSFLIITTACDKKSSDNSEKENPEEKVVGLYSGPGLYGMGGATIELLNGGSFVMKDPYLPEGDTAFGDWTVKGNNINFYMGGRLSFSARFIDDGLIIANKKWEKVR